MTKERADEMVDRIRHFDHTLDSLIETLPDGDYQVETGFAVLPRYTLDKLLDLAGHRPVFLKSEGKHVILVIH